MSASNDPLDPNWHPDHLRHDQRLPVDAISESFALLVKSPSGQKIEGFLERDKVRSQMASLSPEQRAAVMFYLVQEEFCARAVGGKTVDDDYERRFPDFAPIVRKAVDDHLAEASSVRMPPAPAMPNQVLGGRYKLLKPISYKGASSEVWLGEDHTTQARVAIKLAKPNKKGEDNQSLIEGELNPWRRVTELKHSNIVKFLDCGSADDGRRYLVMEFIRGHQSTWEGRTLSDWIRSRSKIDLKTCCEKLATVAKAVHHAHEQGVLHLDIKPDNILLNHRDEPFLSDFGLAKEMVDGRVKLGSFCGSPPYAAPEASRDRDGVMTVRSDVFSLVAVLFEVVTGTKPFALRDGFTRNSDERHRELRRLIEAGAVNPLPEGLPNVIAKLIRRGLSTDPNHRFATAEELAAALTEAAEICHIEENAPAPFEFLPTFATTRFWEPPGVFDEIDRLFDDYHHVALSGQPAMGKTMMSAGYARQREKKFRYRLFAQATTDETLVTQLGRPDIARKLGLEVESGESPHSIARRVRDRLTQLSGWLLVLDDVPDTDADFQRVQQWLPSTDRGGRVLISTTREVAGREVAGLYQVIPVQEWRPRDAIRFLLQGLGQLPDGDLNHADLSHLAEAEELVRDLGGRPLSLESAIQYMTGGRIKITPRDYLNLWQTQPRRLAEKAGANPTNHPSEAATFDLLWSAIQQESSVAADLIRVTAILANAPLPITVLQEYAEWYHDMEQESLDWRETFATALRMLRQPNDDSVTLHALHRSLVLHELDDEQKSDWLNAAADSLDAAFPDTSDRSQWSRCDTIVTHVEIILHNVETILDQKMAARLTANAALLRHRQAEDPKTNASHIDREAERLYRRAIELDPNNANIMGIFALFLTNIRGNHDEAEELYRRAIELDPNNAINMGNFASFLTYIRGGHDEAEFLFRRAIELDPNNAIHVGNFARFLTYIRGGHDEAEFLFRRAIELDPNNAGNMGNFASFLTKIRGNHDEAEKLYRRAIELDPNNAIIMGNFASFLTNIRRNHDEAEKLYRRAVELDPNDAAVIGKFAVFLKNIRGDHDDAERNYRRAIELDSNNAVLIGSFAGFLKNIRGSHDDAERLYRRAIELDSNNANRIGNFVGFLVGRERFVEAREWLDRFDAFVKDEAEQVAAEVAFYRCVICRANGTDDTPHLGILKHLFSVGYRRGPWSLQDHLAVLQQVISEEEFTFYEALAAAILDESLVPRLEEFPRWRELT